MIAFRAVTRFYGHQDVFRGCDLFIGPADRIGLVGPNGAGKTTLLRLILGEEEPNSGEVSKPKDLRIGYLPQHWIDLKGKTVLGVAMDAAGELRRIERELEETTRLLETADSQGEVLRLTERQGRLQEVFSHLGGYELEARAKSVLLGLGFTEGEFVRPIEELSGGWRMRAAIARILLSEPDLILLDEPTNHLDLESLLWMEDFLKQSSSALVVVSHDRVFLNSVVNRIVEIDRGQLVSYGGDYDFYEREKEKRLQTEWAAYENQQERIRQIERFIERNRVRKDRARQVQSRIRQLEKMERLAPPVEQETLHFAFPPSLRPPRILVELAHVSKSYGTRKIYEEITLTIERGDRIALVGPNGVGKTTLMRILRGATDFEGKRRMGQGVSVGVFSQEEIDRLPPHRTVLDELRSVAGSRPMGQLRSLLGAFLFRGDDIFKKVSILSGGEKSRLVLCKILVQPANLLLLDEPTNHLDIPSRKILERALQAYDGALCLVSHDRHLINAVVNKVFLIRDRKVEIYPGNFDDLRAIWRAGSFHSSPQAGKALGRPKGRARTKSRAQKRVEAEWRNRFFREAAPLQEHVSSLEKRIEEATRKLEGVTSELATEETCRNTERLKELSETYRSLKWQITAWTAQWESAALELEELEKRFEEAKPGSGAGSTTSSPSFRGPRRRD